MLNSLFISNTCFFFCVALCVPSLEARVKSDRWNDYFTRAEEEYRKNEYESSLFYLERSLRALEQWKAQQKETNLKSYTYDKILKRFGDCHLRLGKEGLAVDYYEKSLRYNLNQKTILRFLGEYYIDIDDFTKATYYLNQYYQRTNQKDNHIRFLLAYSLAKQGYRVKARAIIDDFKNIKNTKSIEEEDTTKLKECQKYETQKSYLKSIQCYDSFLFGEIFNIKLYYTLIRLAQKIKIRTENRNYTLRKYTEYLYLFYGNEVKHAWPYVFALYNAKRYKQAKEILQKIKTTFSATDANAQTTLEALEYQIDHEMGKSIE